MSNTILRITAIMLLILSHDYSLAGEPIPSVGLNQQSQTFAGNYLHAPHIPFTYRQSGLAGASAGQGPRSMSALATKHPDQSLTDNFFLAYHSFYLPSDHNGAENSWQLLYDTAPGYDINWRNYAHFGVVTRFSKRADENVQQHETISFAKKCESVHGMTASNNGQLIALLCRGYPGPEFLKNEVSSPFPGVPFTDLTPTGGFTNGPHLSSMYILEFHNGQISTNPDHVIRISQAAGGWSYADNEVDFICEANQGCVCEETGSCDGGQYFAHMKVQTNNPDNRHENIYKFIINRPGHEGANTFTRQYARESCGGGHPVENRKAYNSVDKTWGQTCMLDACFGDENPNPEPGSVCYSAYLRTLPIDAVGRDQTNYSNTFMNHFLQNRAIPFESSGGTFSLLSLGQQGFMAMLSGPGDEHKMSPKVGFYIQPLGAEGTAVDVKWNIDATLVAQHGITETGRFGFVQAAPYATLGVENFEQSPRFLIGFSPNIDSGGRSKPNTYMVGEFDRSGDLVGSLLTLNNAGWGENNNWAPLPSSGCVAFAFAFKDGVDGRPGYPNHDQIIAGDDPTPELELYANRGFSSNIQLTTICPDSVPTLSDLIYQSSFESVL